MTDAYYNEWDALAADWLRELQKEGLIPKGHVDERSIADVRAADLASFRQAHFFAGIGGWAEALRLAGVPDLACWTGSAPCQPFSTAGRKAGLADERHIAPVWVDLVAECKPPIIFGEQVAPAIAAGWLDELFVRLEGLGYACGAAVFPAAGVGAPHRRERLYWGAVLPVGHTGRERPQGRHPEGNSGGREREAEESSGAGAVGNAQRAGQGQRNFVEGVGEGIRQEPAHAYLANFWSESAPVLCRDGKLRSIPAEPSLFPLADGVPGRVGTLRGAGNAIVPRAAAVFVEEFLASAQEALQTEGTKPQQEKNRFTLA